MSDESFEQNFAWYEWSFVAPEDLGDEKSETSTARGERPEAAVGAMGWEAVWKRDHP